MATDPVTTPITNTGQLISGVFLGIITMFIRYLTPLPEGVLISILIVNLMTILINYLSIKLYNKNGFYNVAGTYNEFSETLNKTISEIGFEFKLQWYNRL